MFKAFSLIALSGLLAACACPPQGAAAPSPTPSVDKPAVPKALLPNRGKTAARAAGLGNAASFAP